jgi:hypothetical protein
MKWAIVKYEAPETPHHDVAQGACDRVMHAPHNAEGHFLSLGSPLDGLPVGDCDWGADIGASESSPCPALLARIDPTGRRRLIPSG